MTPEGKIQKKVAEYAESLGFLARRNYVRAGGARGWPDTEFYLPGGAVVMMEFKRPGKKPSKIQQHRIDELRKLDHEVHVVDNVEQGKAILDDAVRFGRDW